MTKPIDYCLPIITDELATVEHLITEQSDAYTYFEIWLDYLTDMSNDAIVHLNQQYPGRLIFLFRRQQLEPIQLSIERRQEILNILAGSNNFIDLDITQTEELNYYQHMQRRPRLIVSYHDYKQTPETVQLQTILATMATYQPSIYKLACFCQSPADSLRLLQLLLELKAQAKTVIILGMGAHGLVTRLWGSLWGNELAFAPLASGQQSAPGQLTRQQMETIIQEIHSAGE